jgi:hypothetical protein
MDNGPQIIEVPAPATDPALETDYPLIWLFDASPRIDTPSLVRGVIRPESMIVTYGESNSGKTFHVLDRDLCLAMGRDWYDRETESGFVLYVAAEGAHSIENRLAAYRDELTENGQGVPFAILPQSIDLLTPAADAVPITDFIKRKEDERGIRCVKVTADTLARVIGGGNENSPQDMGTLVNNADRIRHAVGCAFEFVHHSGKDTARGARGHSSLRAATDTEIEVSNDGGVHVARMTKQRDYPIGDEFAFRLRVVELGTDPHGHPVTTCVPDWILDHESRGPRQRLTRQERSALSMLKQVISEGRQFPPGEVMRGAQPAIKQGQFVCPVGALRRRVEQVGGLSDSDKPDSQQRALRRCLQSLRDKGLIGIFEDWAWLADGPDKGGQT